jgi:hypothetical protein
MLPHYTKIAGRACSRRREMGAIAAMTDEEDECDVARM